MHTKLLAGIALLAASSVVGLRGQTTNSSTTANASPTVPPANPVVATAPAAVAPNQIIYTPRLPSVADLTNAAAAQGLAIDRIEQNSAQITVVYRYANGQINTVAYQLLPATGGTATTVQTPSTPPPVVVEAPPRVIYYEGYAPGYYYYGPGYGWYPPVSVHLGFGYRFGGRPHHR